MITFFFVVTSFFSLALPKIKETKEKGATKTSRLISGTLFSWTPTAPCFCG
jgi:hypothetical protein